MSKKGIVSFIFSKLAFLIFGIIISGAFFYFLFIQQNIQQLDDLARNADNIANVVNTVSASPFNISIDYKTEISGMLTFEDNSFTLTSGNKSLNHSLLFTVAPTNLSFENCLHIEKKGNTVISTCQ